MDGEIAYFGLEGKCRLRFNANGNYVQTTDGPLRGTTGFDGTIAWNVDHSGMPRVLEMEEREVDQLESWVLTGRWLAEDGPFFVEVLPEQSAPGQVLLSLKLKDGRLQTQLAIDTTSWLPRLLKTWQMRGEVIWQFGDYREAMGFTLPHKVTHSGPGFETISTSQSLSRVPNAPKAFAPISLRPKDTTFTETVESRIEVKAQGGHILVRPRIDGQDVGWFLLDSGATGMFISSRAAETTKMRGFGKAPVMGAGGTAQGSFRQGKEFQLGPITISKPLYVELDTDVVIAGERIVGGIGYELLSRAVVVIERAGRSVEIHDPGRYELQGAEWHELRLNHKLPCVTCLFEGDRKGVFYLDTGDPGSVTFFHPHVGELELLEGRRTTGVG